MSPDLETPRVGAATHVGLVREHNEDSYLARWPVFVVADGMGGHAAGEVASALAVETVRDALVDTGPTRLEAVRDAVLAANLRIHEQGGVQREQAGMGTTLTGVVVVAREQGESALAVVNVGDSRTYRFFDGRLEQVSTDHSEVQELIALGVLTREGARHHPLRNLLTRSLGSDPSTEPDLEVHTPRAGERWLVCSDGLSDLVDDAQLTQLLAESPDDPQPVADALVQAALDAGGIDNITVLVLDL